MAMMHSQEAEQHSVMHTQKRSRKTTADDIESSRREIVHSGKAYTSAKLQPAPQQSFKKIKGFNQQFLLLFAPFVNHTKLSAHSEHEIVVAAPKPFRKTRISIFSQ
jgi:hypothetical protein